MLNDAGLIAGIEAGGTKFICAVGRNDDEIHKNMIKTKVMTSDQPDQTLGDVIKWLEAREIEFNASIKAIGVASFGPVCLDVYSEKFGFITTTPKKGWSDYNLLKPLKDAFNKPKTAFDTDVNGAAVGEWKWGAGQGLSNLVYITIGTGIGAGVLVNGQPVHGMVHPEIGHMRIPRVPGDDFGGVCQYHGDCWEGLCCGPAVKARAGVSAEELPPDHEAWKLEIKYTACAVANIICTLSPQMVIIGGSVSKGGAMGRERFLEGVRLETIKVLNGYVKAPNLDPDRIKNYIVPPGLGDDAGIAGALALGQNALRLKSG